MELIKATIEDKPLLKNLYSFYLHDLSAYNHSLHLNEEGAFEFDSFDIIWEKEGINPYLIKVENNLIGFFLLLEAPFTKKVDYCINDFFLYQRYRGKGYAEKAIRKLFTDKPGSYYVSQLENNKRAVSFWKKAYQQLGISYEESVEIEEDEKVVYQTFEVK